MLVMKYHQMRRTLDFRHLIITDARQARTRLYALHCAIIKPSASERLGRGPGSGRTKAAK
jgi:hypothetical protein